MVVGALVGTVLAPRSIKVLVLVLVVVVLHLFLHFLLDRLLKPVLGALALINLIDEVLMPVLDVVDDELFAHEVFLAEFATVLFLFFFLLDSRAAELFQVLLDESLLRVKVLLGALLKSLGGHINVLGQVVEAAAP